MPDTRNIINDLWASDIDFICQETGCDARRAAKFLDACDNCPIDAVVAIQAIQEDQLTRRSHRSNQNPSGHVQRYQSRRMMANPTPLPAPLPAPRDDARLNSERFLIESAKPTAIVRGRRSSLGEPVSRSRRMSQSTVCETIDDLFHGPFAEEPLEILKSKSIRSPPILLKRISQIGINDPDAQIQDRPEPTPEDPMPSELSFSGTLNACVDQSSFDVFLPSSVDPILPRGYTVGHSATMPVDSTVRPRRSSLGQPIRRLSVHGKQDPYAAIHSNSSAVNIEPPKQQKRMRRDSLGKPVRRSSQLGL